MGQILIKKKDRWAKTPRLIACNNENENIIKYLVKHGADIYKVIDILNCPIKRYVPRRGLSKKKGYIKKLLVELKDNINDNKKYKRKLVTYKNFKITKKKKKHKQMKKKINKKIKI
jgi:ankyrin repeat protein